MPPESSTYAREEPTGRPRYFFELPEQERLAFEESSARTEAVWQSFYGERISDLILSPYLFSFLLSFVGVLAYRKLGGDANAAKRLLAFVSALCSLGWYLFALSHYQRSKRWKHIKSYRG
jgi:hypothetical protein